MARMSRGSRIAWLVLLAVGATSAGATLRLQDIDQDSWPDTLAFHQLRFSVFRTTAPPLPADHPAGLDAEAILRDALRQNDFVGDFLHRDDAAEVKTVRSAAISLVRGSTTDREKVEHVLSWLASNWDFSVERSTVNAAELWARRQGKCETSGFLVGILATLGIQAREVSDSRFALAVEVRLENRWRVAYWTR